MPKVSKGDSSKARATDRAPAKSAPPTAASASSELRGWANIAKFLGMPVSTVERWAKEGMPVRRAGRNVVGVPDELNRWLQRTTGEPVGTHVVTPESDLLKDLRASVVARKPAAKATPKRKS